MPLEVWIEGEEEDGSVGRGAEENEEDEEVREVNVVNVFLYPSFASCVTSWL